MRDDLHIRPITLNDAGEVLTVQRAAFVQEGVVYDTIDIPGLVQTLDELKAELAINDGCVAHIGHRMVGAVRARVVDGVLMIARLTVVPDLQGKGIGTRLLAAVEARTDAAEAELNTGSLSEGNLRLYRRQGYVETRRVVLPGVELVYLRKRLR